MFLSTYNINLCIYFFQMMINVMKHRVTVHGLMKAAKMGSLSLGCVLDLLIDSAVYLKVSNVACFPVNSFWMKSCKT